VKADEEKIPAASEKKVNLCLDEKQGRALKLLQLSCTGGNSGGGWVEGMREEENLACFWFGKIHWGP